MEQLVDPTALELEVAITLVNASGRRSVAHLLEQMLRQPHTAQHLRLQAVLAGEVADRLAVYQQIQQLTHPEMVEHEAALYHELLRHTQQSIAAGEAPSAWEALLTAVLNRPGVYGLSDLLLETGLAFTGVLIAPPHPQAGPALEERYFCALEKRAGGVPRPASLAQLRQGLAALYTPWVALVGASGVGKTTLLQQAANNDRPRQWLMVDLFSLTAGTVGRGEAEKRFVAGLKKAIAERPVASTQTVLTLDNLPAQLPYQWDALALARLARRAGVDQVVWSVTPEKWKALKDKEGWGAFRSVILEEMDEPQARAALQEHRPALAVHHGVEISAGQLQLLCSKAAAHALGGARPGSWVRFFDECCAYAQVNARALNEETIDAVLRQRLGSVMRRGQWRGLAQRLEQRVFFQSSAVEACVQIVTRLEAGLGDTRARRPHGALLFSGPTGVGKTELTRALAEELGWGYVRLDMSEYAEPHSLSRLLGAPPGYIGHDQGSLLAGLLASPGRKVLVLDEFEKSHPAVHAAFLQAMAEGQLTTAQGTTIDFRECILVLTSNLGASAGQTRPMGFLEDPQRLELAQRQALETTLAPEFRNRLDGIVHFSPLPQSARVQVAERALGKLAERLLARGKTLRWGQEVAFRLAQQAGDEQWGARPVLRAIARWVETPLAAAYMDFPQARGWQLVITAQGVELAQDPDPSSPPEAVVSAMAQEGAVQGVLSQGGCSPGGSA